MAEATRKIIRVGGVLIAAAVLAVVWPMGSPGPDAINGGPAAIGGRQEQPARDTDPRDIVLPDSLVTDEPSPGSAAFTEFEPDANAIRVAPDATARFIQAALDTGRDVLFPAGAVYTIPEDAGLYINHGGTEANTRIIGVYGDGPRPQFRCDKTGLLCVGSPPKSVSHIAIIGLDFYAHKRDYITLGDEANDDGGAYGFYWMMPGENIRFEDCKFSFFWQCHVAGLNSAAESPQGVVVHRCIFERAWGGKDRAQGLSNDTPRPGGEERTGRGITISDSVFFHNGWRPGQERSGQSHNIYLDDNYLRYGEDENGNKTHASPSAPVVVRGNAVFSGSSHGMKCHPGGVVEDNLFARNALAFFVSGNDSVVRRNVVLYSTDLAKRPVMQRGMGVEAFWMKNVLFESNIIAHRDSRGKGEALVSKAKNTALIDNTLWDWRSGYGSLYRVLGNTLGDAGTVTNDTAAKPADPDRSLDGYAKSIGLANEAALIDAMVNRERGVWDEGLDVRKINAYFIKGYRPAR